jgi:hypothetical protein
LELFLERSDTLLYFGLLETLVEFLRVDTDRKSADCDNLAFELDAVWCCRKTPAEQSVSKQGFKVRWIRTKYASNCSRSGAHSRRCGSR